MQLPFINEIIIKVLLGYGAFFHLYVMWFEMFAWETKGPKIFETLPKDLFASTKTMAANQGLYNGFLGFGFLWTFFITDITWQHNIAYFFLSCAILAGIYGSFTVDKKIFFVQGLPALIALILLLI